MSHRWLQALSLLLFAAGLSVSLTGCAVARAAQQPDKKNLNVLSPGVPRNHVIAELGPPVYTENGVGTTTDVFAFKQGYSKGVKASRAVAHGAADVLTWGLWEVAGTPIEMLANGTDVKVEVTYDAARNVESVNVIEGPTELQTRHYPGPYVQGPALPETVQQAAGAGVPHQAE